MRPFLPSWLVPGTWLENARVAAGLGWAGGVELLLFSFEGEDRRLFLSEIEGLREAALEGLGFSVHLPDPLGPLHEEIVRLTASFASSYVLHPPACAGDGDAAARSRLGAWRDLVEGWRSRYGDLFVLEYTKGADFEAADLGSGRSLPLCADTGRLATEGKDIAGWIAQREDRVREIHLHGAEAGRDHRALRGDEAWLAGLSPFLGRFRGIVELEVFSLEGVTASWRALSAVAGGRP